MTTALRATVLYAHGSRDPQWSQAIRAVALEMQRADPSHLVECAYLEMAQPDLGQAVDAVIHAGARLVVVVPMFLGVGQHARNDIPKRLDQERVRHPSVRFELRPTVGENPRVIQLLASVAAE